MSKKMSSLFDHTNGKLEEAIRFARKRMDTSLISNIQWKRRRYGWEEQEVHLYEDFAPYSFYFTLMQKGTERCNLNGGIIFHGKHDGGGNCGAPTYSVCLQPVDGWSTHT